MNHIELKNKVVNYYSSMELPKESKEVIEHLKTTDSWHKIIFNYDGIDDFLNEDIMAELIPGGTQIEVYPKSCPGFKLRLPASNSIEINAQIEYMRLLMIEQCVRSPHRYRNIMDDVSVIDVGASEGIFGYMYCNSTHELHMFDDPRWKECAIHNVTNGRVTDSTFHSGYLSSESVKELKLGKPLGCIKIDVDGPEIEMLNILKDLIDQYHPMIQVATYHYQNEYDEVLDWLSDAGYENVEPSNGWMLYPQDDNQEPPYFRTGLAIAY